MTKLMKALAASGLFAVLSVALIGISMSNGTGTASAQTPPNPPSAFHGTVTVDGTPAGAGTLIEAVVDGTVCGSGYTGAAGTAGASSYALQVSAFDPQGVGGGVNCGTPGDTVLFYIGGKAVGKVGGSGTWNNSTVQRVDLTYTTPTPTPSVTASVTASATAGTGTAAATSTPKAPGTGLGTAAGGGDTPGWLFAAIGLGAIAFGASGVAVARRSR